MACGKVAACGRALSEMPPQAQAQDADSRTWKRSVSRGREGLTDAVNAIDGGRPDAINVEGSFAGKAGVRRRSSRSRRSPGWKLAVAWRYRPHAPAALSRFRGRGMRT